VGAGQREILTTNFLATVALVEACRAEGCEAFIHAGSSSEYGFKDHATLESEPVEPNSEYAVAKASAGHRVLVVMSPNDTASTR
jgi:nucleoside-diphosphate-sugar epimerase